MHPVMLIETTGGFVHACRCFRMRYLQRRRRPRALGSSNRTRNKLLPKLLPSRPAMAALASWPSIFTVQNPRHRCVKTSVASLIARTVPYCEKSCVISSSVVSGGKLATNMVFKGVPFRQWFHIVHSSHHGYNARQVTGCSNRRNTPPFGGDYVRSSFP